MDEKNIGTNAIEKAMKLNSSNMTKAANVLGISRNTLYHKVKKYNIIKG